MYELFRCRKGFHLLVCLVLPYTYPGSMTVLISTCVCVIIHIDRGFYLFNSWVALKERERTPFVLHYYNSDSYSVNHFYFDNILQFYTSFNSFLFCYSSLYIYSYNDLCALFS